MDAVKKYTIYFAHPMSHYNTTFEHACIRAIESHFFTVEFEIMNPNRKWLSNLYLNRLASGDKDSFEIFREIVRSCDATVGAKFWDGSLGAGVAEECHTAKQANKQVLLLDNKFNFSDFQSLDDYTVLSIPETRQRREEGIM